MRRYGKKLLQNLARRFGYEFVRQGSGLDRFLRLLKKQGFEPGFIVDVGANMGLWTRAAIRYFPKARYILVEPQDALRKNVDDLIAAGHRIEWVTAGAGASKGVMTFTIHPMSYSSSFVVSAERAERAGWKQVPVDVLTLNELVESRGLAVPDLVKIDAEGLDLEVLAGVSNLVGKTDVFLIETAICARKLRNSAVAVISLMAEKGYRLMDITDLNRSPATDALWLCEMAFLKETSPIFDSIGGRYL